jgi:hypothetical protein
MANKSKGTWYVSFELPRGKRKRVRATETFPNEREAKKFARAKLVDTPNVSRAHSILICRNGRSPQRRCLNGSKNRMKLDHGARTARRRHALRRFQALPLTPDRLRSRSASTTLNLFEGRQDIQLRPGRCMPGPQLGPPAECAGGSF